MLQHIINLGAIQTGYPHHLQSYPIVCGQLSFFSDLLSYGGPKLRESPFKDEFKFFKKKFEDQSPVLICNIFILKDVNAIQTLMGL